MSFRSTRCILYSGGAHGSTWSNLVIASGTVFNEVHLWRLPSLASLDNFCNKSKSSGFQPHGEVIRVGNVIDVDVFKKLVGHEGVVFYVSFSKDGKLLSSTSDDRTVRLWNADHNAQCEPFHTYYGHTSRVWQSRILESLNYIVTVSEDNTCRVWSYPTLDDAEQEAKCLAVLSGHSGRNCWSVAISNDLGVVATGGADAGIRFWNLKEMKRNLIGLVFFLVFDVTIDQLDTKIYLRDRL
ncbi:WD40-repeat-containing domain protein [Paraphysoderma sedebokerense]|nr:WD40-repeat-containing domain protein [Paraphysoderma sedebokerense]